MTPEMWLLLGMGIFETVASGSISIWLFVLSNRIAAQQQHALQMHAAQQQSAQQQTARVEGLEKVVTAKAEEVVKSRFELAAVEFHGVVAQLRGVVDNIEKRLERGDKVFDRQDVMQRELEVGAETREARLKEWALGLFATQEDMRETKDDVRRLDVAVGKFDERIKHLEKR